MKRILMLFLTVLVFFASIVPAYAEDPVPVSPSDMPPMSTTPPSDGGSKDDPFSEYCPTPLFYEEDGSCVFVLEGDLTQSEVVELYREAMANDPFLGASDIETIARYIKTYTPPGLMESTQTFVQIGKTCEAMVIGEGLGVKGGPAYVACIQTLARVSANFKELACPAVDKLIQFLIHLRSTVGLNGGQKKKLESLLFTWGRLCV